MRRSLSISAGILMLGALGACSGAEPSTGTAQTGVTAEQAQAPPGAPPKLPQEAFDACASAGEGDVCTVTFDGHQHDGKCVRGPDASAPLACAPPRPKPPQEAFDACTGSAEGDACTVTFGGKSHDGKCVSGPHGELPIACLPNDMPPPPPEAP